MHLGGESRNLIGISWSHTEINPRSRGKSPGISMAAVGSDLFTAQHQRLRRIAPEAINLSMVARRVVIGNADKIQTNVARSRDQLRNGPIAVAVHGVHVEIATPPAQPAFWNYSLNDQWPVLSDRLSSVSIAILKKTSTPAGATLYKPRMMHQVPVGISPGRYPGVASLREMKNSARRPPLHPRKPRGSVSELVARASKSPMSIVLALLARSYW